MAKKYRVGIIGSTGRGDYGHATDKAFNNLPNVEVVAVADTDEVGRKKAQQRTRAPRAYADYHKMLKTESPDIVGICPRWIDEHHEMLMASAEAGCHIYMEKPFCRTLKECDEVVAALQMRHLKLGIAHITQYSPVVDKVREIIAAGHIGEVLEVRARGKEDRRGGGLDLWVLGTHVLTLMRTFGGNPSSCSATVSFEGQPVSKDNIFEAPEGIGLIAGDRLHAVYQLENGVVGQFASVKNRRGDPTRFGLMIYGSQGIVELQSGYLWPAYILEDSSWSPGRTGSQWQTISSAGIGQPEPRTDGDYDGGHKAAIRDLIHAIENQVDTKCSEVECRTTVEMIVSVFESNRVGAPVPLPLATRVNPLTLY